jgi:hypothetical protein
MIIPSIEIMDNSLLQKRFANKYLTDARTIRIGNIISFLTPVNITLENGIEYKSDESINFCLEIPDLSNYAGACFQRLFVTNVANILAVKYYTADIEITNSDIVIKKEHQNGGIHQMDGVVSLNSIRNINGAILIYLGLYNKAGKNSTPRAFSLNLTPDICKKFMDTVNESFYNLANSIFLTTAKM